jgi:hypothetical protein
VSITSASVMAAASGPILAFDTATTEAFVALGQLGVPREALYPYLRQVGRNIELSDQALTGPLARWLVPVSSART